MYVNIGASNSEMSRHLSGCDKLEPDWQCNNILEIDTDEKRRLIIETPHIYRCGNRISIVSLMLTDVQ